MNNIERSGIESLALGHSTLKANELAGAIPVITGNYVSPNHDLPLPWPEGDWYLRQTFVPAAQPGETVVCHNLVPNLMAYYRELGLLANDVSILEVEPTLNGVGYGFPGTDPLEKLRGKVRFDDSTGPQYLCSTFGGHLVDQQAEDLGLRVIKRAESSLTNNKSRLRQSAEEFGINLLEGACIGSWDDAKCAIDASWNTSKGSWLKFPTGSGGDLVIKINGIVTDKKLYTAVEQLRMNVKKAFDEGQFSASFDEFWPSDAMAPQDYPLVIEADATTNGEVLANGSTQFVFNKMGELAIVGHFKQITTPSGEYLGNEPFSNIDPRVKGIAEEQAKRAAEYNSECHNYFGIEAIDWFIVQRSKNQPELYVVELNSRPTANTPPVIIANKTGSKHFINTNIYTDRPVYSVDDFIDVVGENLAFGNPYVDGLVVPQSFRTLVTKGSMLPSPNYKVVILGNDSDHCHGIVDGLMQNGVRFEP